MQDTPNALPDLPPSLRLLKGLVMVLMVTMIVGVITVVWLLVTRMPDGNAAPVPPAKASRPFAVFFVHPTSFLSRNAWNAPLEKGGDPEAERITRIYLRGMASAFNPATEIWAPRYRQAVFGAFLTDSADAGRALDRAYADMKAQGLSRRGYGPRRVQVALLAAGIDADDMDVALEVARQDQDAAALAFAKRRRIGPFSRGKPDQRQRQKDFAAMLRAGHDYAVARRILDLPPELVHTGFCTKDGADRLS